MAPLAIATPTFATTMGGGPKGGGGSVWLVAYTLQPCSSVQYEKMLASLQGWKARSALQQWVQDRAEPAARMAGGVGLPWASGRLAWLSVSR